MEIVGSLLVVTVLLVLLRCEASPMPKVLPYPESSFSHLTKNVYSEPAVAKQLTETLQDPEVYPGLWEGDIAGISIDDAYSTWRIGLRWDVFPERKWINSTVPYHISHKYSTKDRETIQSAIYTLSMMTCVDFVPYDGDQEDYLLIWPVENPAG